MTAEPVLIAADLAMLPLAVGLAGGLAVFLLGMELLTDALKLLAGGSMRAILARLTANPLRAALTGVFVTAVIQSSSVTTVLVVGFVSSGLMSLAQAIGIIIGANVGTTITAQVIAFKVTRVALALVAVGFFAGFLGRRPAISRGGRGLLGLGLIFLGMNIMAEATGPFRDHDTFTALLAAIHRPWAALLAGALFTAMIQTSSGTTGLVIIFASQGLIPLETGIAIILGANVGTCVTAWLAALGKSADARRAALAHVVINLIGALLWLPALPLLEELVVLLVPAGEDLAAMAAAAPRRIADAHSIFNIANLLLFIGFTRPLARLLTVLVKDRPEVESGAPRFLDPLLLKTPALALFRVRLELGHLTRIVRDYAGAFPAAVAAGPNAVRELGERDDDIDRLHAAIVGYVAGLSTRELATDESGLIGCYLATANYLEQIGDTLATNGVAVSATLSREKRAIAAMTLPAPLTRLVDLVNDSLIDLQKLFDQDETEAGRRIVRRKGEVVELMKAASDDLMLRLRQGGESLIPVYRAESDFLDLQRRVFYLTRRIAKTMLEAGRIIEVRQQAETKP
ncbi:MAG: Na/Pi cotransporter family protein [Planctomycetes bacterium]|nr:Na/Pi cotransporter family protein [Planctomycetota bacterium]